MFHKLALFCAIWSVIGCQDLQSVSTKVSQQPTITVSSVGVSLLHVNNVCSERGGQGEPPYLTIRHDKRAGVPIQVRLIEAQSDGAKIDLGSVTKRSHASGVTVFTTGFKPPCNLSRGLVDSDYIFEISTPGQRTTRLWGKYHTRLNVIY